MSELVFVDTNVFVYRHDRGDPAKQARADEWIAHLARSRTGRLSFQVLQELYVTLT
ncbi:MAG: PIN domain-containing protein, partial [Gemmatimonadetes bacterium]|nr:PIN domain-containing protein [Gemmatimonadota bacterium]